MSDVPPFSLTGSRYDQSTYIGRIKHFQEFTDSRMLFTSDATLKASLTLLESYKNGTLPAGTTDAQLWEAKKIKEAIIHPDFDTPIFAPARFSAFAPANVAILAILLYPSNHPAIVLGGQVINQSYNVLVNYANRSASGAMSTSALVGAYLGAVGTSCGLAYGLNKVSQKLVSKPDLSSSMRGFIRGFVPFVAVASAGIVNVLMIRKNELTTGIAVFDEEGKQHGYSTAAGRNALAKCSTARVLWNIPLMIFPPMIMARLQKTKLIAENPRLRILTEMGVIIGMLVFFLPPSIAVFPQRDSMATSDLEPQFQSLKDSNGKPITRLFFNKGL